MRIVISCIALSIALATGLAVCRSGIAAAQTTMPTDLAALNIEASNLDPDDYQFARPVCTRCHSPAMFLHSRSWSSWQGIFDQMSGYGARATNEQWNRIYKYFQKSLTLIDLNHADEDELSAVLGIDEDTAVAIVQRRADRKFSSIEDFESVPGVNRARIEAMKQRLLFDPLPDDQ